MTGKSLQTQEIKDTKTVLGRKKLKGREAVLDKQAQINSQKHDGAVFPSLLWILSKVRNGYESAAGQTPWDGQLC